MGDYHIDIARIGNPEAFRLDSGPAATDLAPLRIRRDAGHLHDLGPRAVEEAMLELAAGPHGPAPVETVLARYSRLSRGQIDAAGADRPLRPRLVVLP